MEAHTSRIIAAVAMVTLVLLSGCNQQRQQIRQLRKENAQILRDYGRYSSESDDGDTLYTFLNDLLPETVDGKALVCCVDVSCSVCIGDFCMLVESLKDNLDIDIYALVDSSTAKTFMYYTEKVLGRDLNRFKTIKVDDLEYFFVLLNLPKGGLSFLLSERAIVGKFGLSNGKLITL
jgi:hypothetical protein